MKRKFLHILSLIILAISLVSCNQGLAELKVDIIDVDQGDSILIVTPENKSLLVDSGEEEYARCVIRDLKKQKIKKLDYLLATHSDSDHIGSMGEIIDEVGSQNLILSYDTNLKPALSKLLSSAKSNNTNILRVKSGDMLKLDKDTSIQILAPFEINDDPNKNSIVFLLKYKDYSLVFTGDADAEIESKILQHYDLAPCNFLKAGHHGSKTSSSDKFIKTLRPQITAISCGYNNKYGHPAQDTLNTLSKYNSSVYRTDLSGSLHFYFNDKGIFLSK